MPNCVVKGCKNQSLKNKNQDGITFHTFPIRNKDIREKWIEVIRVSRNEPSWNPTVRSVVCSTRFEDDDFYNTNKGLRRVVRNEYPKVISNVSIILYLVINLKISFIIDIFPCSTDK
ncbi:unnamed protein product [Parnassius mnemosyne]|uniref:THAP-type domain-containing protein n=1 Tax=Parnassius mnemosyne TaxID=213953 RepID=A0AAV1KR28_9NEOP